MAVLIGRDQASIKPSWGIRVDGSSAEPSSVMQPWVHGYLMVPYPAFRWEFVHVHRSSTMQSSAPELWYCR